MIRILVVEDDKMVSDVLSLVMIRFGYDVDAYIKPTDALQDYELNKYKIIITDLDIPDMNGIEFIDEIRKIDKEIPIIICSGFISKDVEDMQEKLNISYMFNKPPNIMDLNNKVKELIR